MPIDGEQNAGMISNFLQKKTLVQRILCKYNYVSTSTQYNKSCHPFSTISSKLLSTIFANFEKQYFCNITSPDCLGLFNTLSK